MAEALDRGKAVFSELEKSGFAAGLDSLGASQKVEIRFITPGSGNGRAIEQELIDAYERKSPLRLVSGFRAIH